MTKKSVESFDENGEKETLTGLVAIDHQQFNTQVSYQNQNQPTAPQTVTLELAGNEVMTAKWDKVDDAAGYAVTIYQKNGGKWIDTGFGYDLDKETTSMLTRFCGRRRTASPAVLATASLGRTSLAPAHRSSPSCGVLPVLPNPRL